MRIVFFAIIMCLAFSCKEEPTLTIPKTTMVAVIKDMLIAEAAISKASKIDADSLRNTYYPQLYEIHKVDSTIVAKNMVILGENPALSVEIYSLVEEEFEIENPTDDEDIK